MSDPFTSDLWLEPDNTFKDLTDAMLMEQTEFLQRLETAGPAHLLRATGGGGGSGFNDLQASPQYPAGWAETGMSDLATMRTDVIGSLLRPERLKQARHRFDAGEADAAELRVVEDECIREAVALQEDAGLEVVTDGELRRLNFQDSFGACVEGFRSVAARIETLENQSRHGKALQRWDVHRDVEAGVPVWHRLPAAERLRLARNLPLDEYRHVSTVARTPAKVTAHRPGPHQPALRSRELARHLPHGG
ncbi:MAG: hypothetical protein OXK20_00885 [Deltaproteobacteria bacterium]|nr:hypothetical protein [Deltaproteobacteria bacterium]